MSKETKETKENIEKQQSAEQPQGEATQACDPECGENPEVAKKSKKDDKLQKEIEKLKAQIADLEKNITSEKDSKLRLMAEYDNFRKRSQREKTEIYPDAVASTVAEILPVIDNFERALSVETSDEKFKKGIEMIFSQLSASLGKLKIEAIGKTGDSFDPLLHNAVMHIEDDTLGENVVCDVFQKGYRLGDKVIRCAMVKVAN